MKEVAFISLILTLFLPVHVSYAAPLSIIGCHEIHGNNAWAFVVDFENQKVFQPENSIIKIKNNNEFVIIRNNIENSLILVSFEFKENKMMDSFFIVKNDPADKAEAASYKCEWL